MTCDLSKVSLFILKNRSDVMKEQEYNCKLSAFIYVLLEQGWGASCLQNYLVWHCQGNKTMGWLNIVANF